MAIIASNARRRISPRSRGGCAAHSSCTAQAASSAALASSGVASATLVERLAGRRVLDVERRAARASRHSPPMKSCVGTASTAVRSWVALMPPPSPFRVPPRWTRRASSRSGPRSGSGGPATSACRRCRPKSSTDSQRQAGIPKASASLTKSGFVKSVPKWRPNFLSCFQTIEPNWEFSQMTLTIGVFSRTAVSSSWTFIRKPPSPLTVTTRRPGCTSLAAIAVGSAIPIPARPLAISTVLGSCAGNMRAIHSLCRPTSEISMSWRPSAWRISHSARGGCIGNASSSLAASKRPSTMSSSRELRDGARRVPQLLGQAAEDVVEVADEVDLGDEVLVDLGRDAVDADDLLVALRVPVRRRVLDEVVADRDRRRRRPRTRPARSRATAGRPCRARAGPRSRARPCP